MFETPGKAVQDRLEIAAIDCVEKTANTRFHDAMDHDLRCPLPSARQMKIGRNSAEKLMRRTEIVNVIWE